MQVYYHAKGQHPAQIDRVLSGLGTKSATVQFRLQAPMSANTVDNRPRSIYQYSNMVPRLSGLKSIFGVVSFVSKSLLGIERQKKLEKFAILTRKPRSHA